MRARRIFASLGAMIVAGASNAQAPDFSGIYEGASTTGEPDAYPFTAAGERGHDAYDPLTGDPEQYDDCAPESMPSILWSGTLNTLELVSGEEVVQITYEHGGTVRSIHIDGAAPAADAQHTEIGHSVGHWADGVLTVETTHLTGGVIFADLGYPLSEQTRITERYWREPGEQNLQMELVLVDPVNYTEPVTLTREWIWAPHEQVFDWNCVSLGPRDAEPDLDEIRRLLTEL